MGCERLPSPGIEIGTCESFIYGRSSFIIVFVIDFASDAIPNTFDAARVVSGNGNECGLCETVTELGSAVVTVGVCATLLGNSFVVVDTVEPVCVVVAADVVVGVLRGGVPGYAVVGSLMSATCDTADSVAAARVASGFVMLLVDSHELAAMLACDLGCMR